MKSQYQFIGLTIALLGLWGAWSLKDTSIREYFSQKTGKGVLKGILLAVGITVAVVALSFVFGCSGTFNNGATIFTGLDYTKKLSPQCEDYGPDSHTTSNLGFRYGLYESKDGKFRSKIKYTHHSCAFSEDREQYDAIGIEHEYVLW